MAAHLERSAKQLAWMRGVTDAEETRILWLNIIRAYFPLGEKWIAFPDGDHTVRDLPPLLTLFQIDNNVPRGELPKKHGVIVVLNTDLQTSDGRAPANDFWEAATAHLINVLELMMPRASNAPTVGIVTSGPWFVAIQQKTTGLFERGFTHVPVKSSRGGHAAHAVDDGDSLAHFIKETMTNFEETLPKPS